MTLEPYLGAYFTIRYNDMKDSTGKSFTSALDALGSESAGLITSQTHPVFFSLKGTIVKRAELEYGFREINAETPDMWDNNCKRLMIELADKYEPALAREADDDFDASMIEDGKVVSKYGSNISNRFQDTPFGELNATSDYTSSQSHAQRGGSDEVLSQTGSDAENLRKLRDKWESTMNVIIKEIGDLFIHTIAMDVRL